MSKNLEMDYQDFEKVPLAEFAEKAYLDYSMYVILDRALPFIGDGLKPVQRRIVYAMSELGLSATAKPKKSARTVGDVIGKYHPHGDSACYEAMVLMAQSFSYRYPLVDGQGNWGSADDPKSFAAMRYTESRLTPYAKSLLEELGQGTVDWQPNFDGTLDEPLTLPARLPNVLLNGGMGIAVGMSTDIPPHNLREVVSACLRLLDEPKASVEQLCEHVKGPDFATGAELVSTKEEVISLYETGHGQVRVRAIYEKEAGSIVVIALPYQVSGAKVLEQIAQQMQAKKLPMVEDLRDESDHENPTRIVIVPKSNRVDVDELMLHLFATTDLERSYRVNMNVIGQNGRPQVKNLRVLLSEWLEFRKSTVTRRLQWRLDKIDARLHILEGLLIAYLNIDEVIQIIRTEDKPRQVLMERFALSVIQADAILDIKLRQLAKLEEIKIKAEQKELAAEKAKIEKILASAGRLKKLIAKELQEDAEQYGDDRRTQITQRPQAKVIDQSELVPAENITLVLSQQGWVRIAKGHEIDPATLTYKSGDAYLSHVRGKSNMQAVFFDTAGRAYTLPAHSFPSARGLGEPLSSRVKAVDGCKFVGALMGAAEDRYLLCTDFGYAFVCALQDMYSRGKNGKQIVNVPAGAQLLAPVAVRMDQDWMVAVTTSGYMLVLAANELPEMSKGKGVKAIGIPSARLKQGEERVAHVGVVQDGMPVTLFCGKKHKTMKGPEVDEFVAERGRRGYKLARGYQNVDRMQIEEN